MLASAWGKRVRTSAHAYTHLHQCTRAHKRAHSPAMAASNGATISSCSRRMQRMLSGCARGNYHLGRWWTAAKQKRPTPTPHIAKPTQHLEPVLLVPEKMERKCRGCPAPTVTKMWSGSHLRVHGWPPQNMPTHPPLKHTLPQRDAQAQSAVACPPICSALLLPPQPASAAAICSVGPCSDAVQELACEDVVLGDLVPMDVRQTDMVGGGPVEGREAN